MDWALPLNNLRTMTEGRKKLLEAMCVNHFGHGEVASLRALTAVVVAEMLLVTVVLVVVGERDVVVMAGEVVLSLTVAVASVVERWIGKKHSHFQMYLWLLQSIA
jgi:hypothetical protein